MESSGIRSRLSWIKVLLAGAIIPPVGLLLAWLIPWPAGTTRRIFGFAGRLAFSFVLAILSITYAANLGLVRVEMSGAGWKPMFTLRDAESDQTALELDRVEQQAQLAAQPLPKPMAPPPVSDLPVIDTGTPWPDFRGSRRDGVYDGPILAAFPSEGLKPLWKQPIGGGYASFVIAQGKAYTIEQRRNQEVVTAYDVRTGRELWTHGWPNLFSEAMGGDGPRATPVWDDGRIFALGASGEFRVLDAESGKSIWSKNILNDNGAENLPWGMSNAPLIFGDTVIVTPGGPNGRSVVAYNKKDGKRVWSTLDDPAAYTSPMLGTLAGQPQMVVVTGTRAVGMAPGNGTLLWEFPWVTMSGVNSAQPIFVDSNRVFLSAGYDHGSVLLEISKAGSGFEARAVWETRNLKNRFNSSVLHDGHIYGFDEGIFAAIDARTGERDWKGGRYGYGQALLAGDRIVVLSETGELVLLQATPEGHRELGSFPAIEGKTWNHPAIADGILLVRNAREMAAFRIGS